MIASILDNDLYKFTVQQVALDRYPHTQAVYRFINRSPGDPLGPGILEALRAAIHEMSCLALGDEELRYLRQACPYFQPAYLAYLQNYRFDPQEVQAELDVAGRLAVTIRGPWHRTTLWEVPLLATISELYFRHVRTDWNRDGQLAKIRGKGERLRQAGCTFADFGTRRRRDYATQEMVVGALRGRPGFSGTSNVHFARTYDVKPVGTIPHEFIMAHSVFAGLRHANRCALQAWAESFHGQMGIALTDTYGSAAFFADFDGYFARLYDGLRQDSGDPRAFVETALRHYQSLGVNPQGKTIVFSDALTPESAVELKRACTGRIGCSFGIGTNLTNDFAGSPPLNIVIKPIVIDGTPVVKLTDDPGKASGDPEALRVARWTMGF
jgi:nicotinate phosphoribosyltransferase